MNVINCSIAGINAVIASVPIFKAYAKPTAATPNAAIDIAEAAITNAKAVIAGDATVSAAPKYPITAIIPATATPNTPSTAANDRMF